ncbi:MAG: precorrin-2 C(20)-methyltransferase [Candidatus Manganitrophaceae bacterium]|nr:MAG: precorrin-2 C(20)-methyltransferase [Candidatus Manganitrophaceae bacterium]
MKLGKFYGVGVGPGDPELLTIKALNRLRSVDVLCYPACRPGAGSYALRIVQELVGERAELKGLLFPMEREMERLVPIWKESVAEIYADLSAGREVAFITEGDPFFYSTFVYLYDLMRQLHPDVTMEVIPGVSSVMAASVRAGVPLAMADERMAVLPATYEDAYLKEALDQFDTVVFIKVSSVLPKLIALLEQMKLIDRAVMVERCGSAEERLVRDLATLKEERLNYLSLVIVKKNKIV